MCLFYGGLSILITLLFYDFRGDVIYDQLHLCLETAFFIPSYLVVLYCSLSDLISIQRFLVHTDVAYLCIPIMLLLIGA